MGRIKTIYIKNLAIDIMEKLKDNLNNNFEKNKDIIEKYYTFSSKRMRNMIVGYITREIKRMKK